MRTTIRLMVCIASAGASLAIFACAHAPPANPLPYTGGISWYGTQIDQERRDEESARHEARQRAADGGVAENKEQARTGSTP